jgi:hypothetical protein
LTDFEEIHMEIKAKALRAALRDMIPAKSVPVVKSFGLTPDEEKYIIAVDIRRKSIAQTAMENHASEETVKRGRERGFARMILELTT